MWIVFYLAGHLNYLRGEEKLLTFVWTSSDIMKASSLILFVAARTRDPPAGLFPRFIFQLRRARQDLRGARMLIGFGLALL